MAVTEHEPPIVLPDVADLDAVQRWIDTARTERPSSRPRCKRCRVGFDAYEESAMLRKGWCYTCESNWLEPRLQRLIDRVGRKAALLAVRRLTR